jgi:hypothetical protein
MKEIKSLENKKVDDYVKNKDMTIIVETVYLGSERLNPIIILYFFIK